MRARLASGLILGAVAVVAGLLGGLVFNLFLLLIFVLAAVELRRLASSMVRYGDLAVMLGVVIGGLLTVAGLWSRLVGAQAAIQLGLPLLLTCTAVVLLAPPGWGLGDTTPDAVAGRALFRRAGLALTAMVLLFATAALVVLRDRPHGIAWVVDVAAITWGCDTCAYGVGKMLGRRRFWPRVSPSKTWEGTLGGVIGGAIAGLVVAALTQLPLPFGAEVGLAVTGSVSAVVGDLCESALKRWAGVKDSGRLVPGHGGVLDRIDSLVFVTLVAYAWSIAATA